MAMPILSGYVTYGGLSILPQVAGDTAHPVTFNPVAPNGTGALVGSAIAAGDWMVVVFMTGSTYAGSQIPSPPSGSGWTEFVPFQVMSGGTSCFGVWGRQRNSGDTTYTISVNADTGRGTAAYYRTFWFSGALDVSNWVIGTFASRTSNATTTTSVAPSIVTTRPDSYVLHLSGERTVAVETEAQVTVSSGFTKDMFNNSQDGTLLASHLTVANSGTTVGPVTTTYPNPHNYNGIAGLIAIPGSAPAPSGLQVKVSNGTSLTTAYLKVSNGGGSLMKPGGLKVVKPGYDNVTTMLATTPFTIAHRGGSRDFPEMSLYAYGQSALLGYGALELSVGRTSDGVWFGLHDADLNRTSGTTGLAVASTMTWADVQSYQILGSMAANNPSQPNRPYMRIEELFSLYYPSHVIFLDLKYAGNYSSEMISYLSTLPGTASDHIVIKSFGVSSRSYSDTWRAAGYKLWGYYYQSNIPDLPSTYDMWDILGMDYNADGPSWTTIKSYGKPVIAHILPNTAAVATAAGYGADGYMVAGVKAITPGIT